MKMIRYNSVTGERVEYEDGDPLPPLNCSCPCCGYQTLAGRDSYEICPVCFWGDDGQDDRDADQVRGGPKWRVEPDSG